MDRENVSDRTHFTLSISETWFDSQQSSQTVLDKANTNFKLAAKLQIYLFSIHVNFMLFQCPEHRVPSPVINKNFFI